jgi:hypothetical protein
VLEPLADFVPLVTLHRALALPVSGSGERSFPIRRCRMLPSVAVRCLLSRGSLPTLSGAKRSLREACRSKSAASGRKDARKVAGARALERVLAGKFNLSRRCDRRPKLPLNQA